MNERTIPEQDYRLTASGAGKVFDPPLTSAGIVSLSNRGVLPCVRDNTGRRLFAMRDLLALKEQRARKRATVTVSPRQRGRRHGSKASA